MHVIHFERPGPADVLELREADVPSPGAGEVLIEVHAAGLNRPDLMQREGLYPAPADASPILGLEVSGIVVAVGEGVVSCTPGERVSALTPGGGYAEYALAPADHCLPWPPGLSHLEAAVLPEAMFTVWHNVFDRGCLERDETLLVHGGASGIGSFAIQVATALGARVFCTAGSDPKCDFCRDLGAELAVNYRERDFVDAVLEATGDRGVDVILDMVGGDYMPRNFRAAAADGRIVSIAVLGGVRTEVNIAQLMFRRLTWTGSTLRAQSVAAKARIARALRERVWPLIESGRVRPQLDRVFPLEAAADAHRHMQAGMHRGKIALEVRAPD